MKNLENFGVQELDTNEIREIEGGFLLFFLGFGVGMWIMDLIFGEE